MEVSQEVRPVRRRDQGDVMCRGLQPRARVAVHVGVQYEVTETVVLMIMIYIREYDICDICKARKG